MSTDLRAAYPAPDRRLRLASHPGTNPGNPYIDLFYRALSRYGVEHVGRLVPDASWLDGPGRDVDVVHIHWPERIWRGKRLGRLDHLLAWTTARSARGVLRLRQFLRAARERGVTCVWTVHNVAHHEGTSPLDRWGYGELARNADLLVCFSEAAAGELRHAYGPEAPVLVISHGSYQGAYPRASSRSAARARFGLRDDLPVVSCLGLLRRYKGVELACEAVEALAGHVQLLVGGRPQRTFDVDGLEARAARSGGAIRVVPRVLTDDEFSDAIAASDAVLLPYHAVTGSGVLFAAWTLGAGVIASDLPFFREMLDGRPLCGQTFRRGDATDLSHVIGRYLQAPADLRRQAIASVVDALTPETVVQPFVEALLGLRQRDTARAPAYRRA